jgi:hypothetical protein
MIYIYEWYIAPGAILFPLIIAIVFYKRLDISLKVMMFFLVFIAIMNTIITVLSMKSINNLFLVHIYTVFEFAFLSWFYKLQLKGLANKIIPVLIGLFTLLCLVNYFFIQKSDQSNTYTRSIEAVIIIGYCILLFSKQSLAESGIPWRKISVNWINVGVLMYYSGCFFTFVFMNYLMKASHLINHIVWGAMDTLLLFEYILFAVGFYQCKKQPITSSY